MTIIQTNKPLAKRRAFDFYETPRNFCDEALELLPDFYAFNVFKEDWRPPLHILDPGCGTGVWGQAALDRWPDAIVDGAEIRNVKKPKGYRYIYKGDFGLLASGLGYDLIIGNPPFIHAEMFVRSGLANLSEDGYMLYLLPLRFLASKGRTKGLFRHTPPLEVHVAHRVSFTGNGKSDDTEYAVYIWKRGWQGATSLKWMLRNKS